MFYATTEDMIKGTSISFSPLAEIWIKAYFPLVADPTRLFVVSNKGQYGPRFENTITLYRDDQTNDHSNYAYPEEGTDIDHEVFLHIKPGNSDGVLDLSLDRINIANELGSIGGGNPIQGLYFDRIPRYLIIGDFDISNYYIAKAPVIDVDNNWNIRKDGRASAEQIDSSISAKVDLDALKGNMRDVVINPEIVAVSVGAANIVYDSNSINSLKITVNDTDIGTKTINNRVIDGALLTNNPATGKPWTLEDLSNAKFILTAKKV